MRQQFIRTGETRGDFVAVTDGLKAGEKVVSTGVFKLRNGDERRRSTTHSRQKPNYSQARRIADPRVKTFTDLFIRRPVLALVVSLVIVIAGLQAISSLNVRQYPRSDIASVTVTTVYVGAERGTGARFHHHPAGARDRRGRRHRLPAIAEYAGRLDHHRAAAN